MDELQSLDSDGHGQFRDLCVIYGDNFRPVFLEEFCRRFVESADRPELVALRKAVSTQAARIGKKGKKGRPRTQDDPELFRKVRKAAWHRFVDGWEWPRIAVEEGLRPTKPNLRTVQRRVDTYAALICNACRGASVSDRNLQTSLATQWFRQWLWVRVGLFGPSDDPEWIAGCEKLVTLLLPRGVTASGSALVQRAKKRAIQKKQR